MLIYVTLRNRPNATSVIKVYFLLCYVFIPTSVCPKHGQLLFWKEQVLSCAFSCGGINRHGKKSFRHLTAQKILHLNLQQTYENLCKWYLKKMKTHRYKFGLNDHKIQQRTYILKKNEKRDINSIIYHTIKANTICHGEKPSVLRYITLQPR